MINYKQRHFKTAQEIWNALRPEELKNHFNSNTNLI